MLKCSSDRCVCAPQSLSAGTSTSPRLSVSLRVAVMGCLLWTLKLDLCPEADDDCVLCSAAIVREELDDRLEQQHRKDVQQRIELEGVFRVEWRRTRRRELLADAILDVPERHGVVKRDGQRFIEAQPRRELRVVAVDVGR